MDFTQYKKDLPFLVECGLVAIKQGDEESAKKLFSAATQMDPSNLACKMGYGLIAMHKMEVANAKTIFEEITTLEPTNWRAKAFLSLCNLLHALSSEKLTTDEKLACLENATNLANEVIERSDVASTKDLARSILDWQNEIVEKMNNKSILK